MMENSRKRLTWKKLLNGERVRNSKGDQGELSIRNEFDKDYERIIYSSSVRRLQDKAQVFPLQRNDFTRTRLTHSLEVASLGRSMAWSISEELFNQTFKYTHFGYQDIADKELDYQEFKTIEKMKRFPSLVEVACLVHDLGNPPFGHYGEDIIKKWFSDFFKEMGDSSPYLKLKNEYKQELDDKLLQEKQDPKSTAKKIKKLEDIITLTNEKIQQHEMTDFTNFDGNAQTIRILTKLQFLNDEHGANFTLATLATLMKYPWSSHHPEKAGKFGFMSSETDIYEEIKKKIGIGPHRHPATFIVEAADDIAYLTADIEDGVKKNLITWKDLEDGYKIVDLLPKLIQNKLLTEKGLKNYKENIKSAEDNESPDLDLVKFQNYKVTIQGALIQSAKNTFNKKYDDIMNGTYKSSLLKSEEISEVIEKLKKIAMERCFSCNEVIRLELVGDRVIHELLNLFIPAVLTVHDDKKAREKKQKLVQLISTNFTYIQKFNKQDKKNANKEFYQLTDYQRIQLVIDFISGMTDTYATDLHRELTNGMM